MMKKMLIVFVGAMLICSVATAGGYEDPSPSRYQERTMKKAKAPESTSIRRVNRTKRAMTKKIKTAEKMRICSYPEAPYCFN